MKNSGKWVRSWKVEGQKPEAGKLEAGIQNLEARIKELGFTNTRSPTSVFRQLTRRRGFVYLPGGA